MVVFAFAEQVWVILLARSLQGIASSLLWLSAQAITADEAGDRERGQAFGAVTMSSYQGSILGVFIGFGVLISLEMQDGWQPLFLGYGLVSLAAGALAWRSLPETRRAPEARPARPIPWSRSWILLLLVTSVTGATATMLAPVIMIYLQEKLSAGISAIAWASLPAALVTALLPSKLGSLADRFGRKPFMVLGLAVAAATSLLFPWIAGSLVALAIFWALESLCFAAGDPAEQALVADLTGDEQRGRAYGLYALAGGLGAAVGPLVGGWLYETVGPSAPFIANGIGLAACALILGIFLEEPLRQKEIGACPKEA
jgi:MFS family permease